MEAPIEETGRWYYRALEPEHNHTIHGKYSEFSGRFKSEDKALEWYKEHGVFFEGRGIKLRLFCNGQINN